MSTCSCSRQISYKAKPEKGQRGPALRVTNWDDAASMFLFQCGSNDTDEYKDIVLVRMSGQIHWCACVQNVTKQAFLAEYSSPIVYNNGYFVDAEFAGVTATNLLLATYALIQNLGVGALEMYGTKEDGTPDMEDIQCLIKNGNIVINNGIFNGHVQASAGQIGGLEIEGGLIKALNSAGEVCLVIGSQVPSIANAKVESYVPYTPTCTATHSPSTVKAVRYGNALRVSHSHVATHVGSSVIINVTAELSFTLSRFATQIRVPNVSYFVHCVDADGKSLVNLLDISAVLYKSGSSTGTAMSLVDGASAAASSADKEQEEDMESAVDSIYNGGSLSFVAKGLSLTAGTTCRVVVTLKIGVMSIYDTAPVVINTALCPQLSDWLSLGGVLAMSTDTSKCIYLAKDGLAVIRSASDYMIDSTGSFEVVKGGFGLKISASGGIQRKLSGGSWQSANI